MLEYLQQLQDKVLKEETALLEDAEESQVVESKCKKVAAKDKERQQPSKEAKEKQKEKYCRGTAVKTGDANLYERYMNTGQDCLVHHLR